MNDHRARVHDVVQPHGTNSRLTVNAVDGPDDNHLLHTSLYTGGPDIPLHESAVDVLTPAGAAR